MGASSSVIAAVAQELWTAEQDRRPVAPLTGREWLVDDDAYPVQLGVVALRQRSGHRVVGKKIGLTSRPMQELAGVFEPDYGHLFDVMRVEDHGIIDVSTLIAPLVEPEVAFVLERPLAGPSVAPIDVLRATAFVTAALEVVDSRIEDWKVRWLDTVADNGSSARFVLSEQVVSPLALDFAGLGTVLERNGVTVETATMGAVLGSPLRSICWLVQKLHGYGLGLEAGDVVLPGSPCRALRVEAGDHIRATIAGVGTVSVSFEGTPAERP